MVECLTRDVRSRVRASPASLRCGPYARHIYPSLVLVQPRKNRPYITERLLMGRKESKQTKTYVTAFYTCSDLVVTPAKSIIPYYMSEKIPNT